MDLVFVFLCYFVHNNLFLFFSFFISLILDLSLFIANIWWTALMGVFSYISFISNDIKDKSTVRNSDKYYNHVQKRYDGDQSYHYVRRGVNIFLKINVKVDC